MPWSWVKVPVGTSSAMAECVRRKGGANPKGKDYEECTVDIAKGKGCTVSDPILWEADGRNMHVHLKGSSEDLQQAADALGATDHGGDHYTLEELTELLGEE